MRLFISYAHKNRSKIDELQNLLGKIGNEVWFDHELSGGDDWWQRILDEIEQSDVFVFALSPKSTASAACRVEYQYALDLNKPILPILLKEAELPFGKLQETQYIDARRLDNSDTVASLSRSLLTLQQRILGGNYAVPDPAPPRPEFPFGEDPLKDLRTQVRNLKDIATDEDNIIRLIFRLKQVGQLSNKTARESRLLLETIMTSPHISPSMAKEVRDLVALLPQPNRRPAWMYGVGVLAVVIVLGLALLLLAPSLQPTPGVNKSAVPIAFEPKPVPTSVYPDQTVITVDNAAQIERLHWVGRGRPWKIAWSPAGNTLAISGMIGIVWLVDASDPAAPPRPLEGHSDRVKGVAFSPSGERLASASWDGTVRLWDVASGSPIGNPIVAYEDSSARSVAFSPDERLLAVGGCWNVQIFDITDPEQPVPLREQEVNDNCAYDVAFNPDGTLVAYAGREEDARHYVEALDVNDGSTHSYGSHNDYIWSVVFSPDGNLLASANANSDIALWDIEGSSGSFLLQELEGHSDEVNDAVFTLDGKYLISASDDRTIRLWDVETGKPIGEPLEGHIKGVYGIALNPEGDVLASVGQDGTLRFWDVNAWEPLDDPLPLFNSSGRDVAFTHDSTQLVTSYWDSSIHLWDIMTQVDSYLATHDDIISRTNIAVNPADSNISASGGADDTVRLFDLSTREEIAMFERTGSVTGDVMRIAFSPDGTRIAAAMAGGDDVVRVWNIEDGTNNIEQVLDKAHGDVYSVAFHPTGDLLVAGYGDGAVILWNLATGEPHFTLEEHDSAVRAVAFSPDGKFLLSGGDDKKIRTWNVATGELDGTTLSNPNGGVKSLAFSPDGTLLAAGTGNEDEMWLWDMTDIHNPQNIIFFPMFDYVATVAFSPDGTLLAAIGDSGAVSIWGIP